MNVFSKLFRVFLLVDEANVFVGHVETLVVSFINVNLNHKYILHHRNVLDV